MNIITLVQIMQLHVEQTTVLARGVLLRQKLRKRKRAAKRYIARLNYTLHLHIIRDTGFENRYHMTKASFDYLVYLLRPLITIDFEKSVNSTGDPNLYITPEMVVMASLRILGGEKPKSMEDIFGPRRASVDRIFMRFLKACLDTVELHFRLPATHDELTAAALGFHGVSEANGLFYGTCGCLDGFMMMIDKPPLDVSRDFRSEYYKSHAVNTQCICDSNLRFMYTNVAAPGKTSDSVAFNMSKDLTDWLRSLARPELEKGFYIMADAAYPLTDYTLTPFSGNGLTESQKDYNFFLSQQRIRIEMTFGRLTSKFRIFRSSMSYDLVKINRIFLVSAMLHNFIIDNDNVDVGEEDLLVDRQGAFMRWEEPHVNHIEGEAPARDPLASSSTWRDLLVELISANDQLTRPLHNRLRNENNADN